MVTHKFSKINNAKPILFDNLWIMTLMLIFFIYANVDRAQPPRLSSLLDIKKPIRSARKFSEKLSFSNTSGCIPRKTYAEGTPKVRRRCAKGTPKVRLALSFRTPGIFREREAAIILLYCYRFYRKNDAATPTKSQVYAGDLRAEMHGIHPGQYGKEVNKHVRKVRGSINKGWNWWHH